MLNPWHNGGDEDYQVQFGGIPGRTDLAIDCIPNDIILLLWWTDKRNVESAPKFFSDKGYDYWAEGSAWLKSEPKPKGCLITTWQGFKETENELINMVEAMW